MELSHLNENGKLSNNFVVFIPWLLFSLATINSLFVAFSHWAINADLIGKHNLGAALFFSFSFPLALYISIGILVVSLVMAVLYRNIDKKGCKILLFAASIGFSPMAYILVRSWS